MVKKKMKTTAASSIGQLDAVGFLKTLVDDLDTPDTSQEDVPDDNDSDEEGENNEEEEEGEDEEELHRRQLAEMAKTDPEFHAHLKREAKDLLDFGNDGDDDDDDNNNNEHSEDDQDAAAAAADDDDNDDNDDPSPASALSLADIKSLERKAINNPTSTRQLIRAFRSATRASSAQQKLASPECFERLMTVSVVHIARALDSLLWKTEDAKKKQTKKRSSNPSASPLFSAHVDKVRLFLQALTKVLASHNVSPSILRSLLLHARMFVPYYACRELDREARHFLDALLSVWARPDETEGASRVAAFLRVRQLCDSHGLLEMALKNAYVAFARGATTSSTVEARERIGVQMRCLVELYGINPNVSYRVAFGYVRQLALHVRAAMSSKTQESLQSVCSWQFMHCFRLWGFVFAAHHPVFAELEFPLVQVGLGIFGLVSTARYVPLRIHCVDVLNRLCRVSKLYAPVAMPLLSILATPDLASKKAMASTERPPQLDVLLKFKTDALRKNNCRLVVVPRVCDALRFHLRTHRASVAFPELWAPVRHGLVKSGLYQKPRRDHHHNEDDAGKHKKKRGDKRRRPSEGEEADAWRSQAHQAIDRLVRDCDAWAAAVREAREGRVGNIKRPGGPSDLKGCEAFEQALHAQFEAKHGSRDAEPAHALDSALPDVTDAIHSDALGGEKNDHTLRLGGEGEDNEDHEEEEAEGTRAFNSKEFL